MKKIKNPTRPHQLACYLSDEELQKVTALCQDLGIKMSDLIRSRLLHPGMLNINPSKLLLIFSEIGLDLARINSLLSEYFKHQENLHSPAAHQAIAKLAGEHILAQSRLEMQIRALLIRIEMRE